MSKMSDVFEELPIKIGIDKTRDDQDCIIFIDQYFISDEQEQAVNYAINNIDNFIEENIKLNIKLTLATNMLDKAYCQHKLSDEEYSNVYDIISPEE